MKIEKVICDCCGKTVCKDEYLEASVPILFRGDRGNKLIAQKMDLCGPCANEFANLYYSIARKHGSSGICAIDMGEEEE